MLRFTAVCLMFLAGLLTTPALARSEPDATVAWASDPATDAAGTRNCSVYPLRDGAFPMLFFYGSEGTAELSIVGARNPPMELTLQVDANPELDGGVLAMSPENTATLVEQIRAGGRNLRLSQSVMFEGKLERFDLDLPLEGAVEQLDKCHSWLAR